MMVLFFRLTLGLYFVGTVLSLVYLLRRTESLSKSALAMAGLGFFCHSLALAAQIFLTDQIPLVSFQKAMSFFSWALVLVFLFVAMKQGLHILGTFILPLAFLSLVSAVVFPVERENLHPFFQTVWIHVTLSMLGTVGFAVAFAAGIMYVMQERLLKSKQFNVLTFKLPPLDFLDSLNQRSILLGFPFLTLGILTGALSAQLTGGSYLSWNPEQTLALMTWMFYLIVLLGRLTLGWRAQKAAYLTIVGFIGVVLTFLGVLLKGGGPAGNL